MLSLLSRKVTIALVTLGFMLVVAEVVVRAVVPVRNVGPSFTVFDAERGVSLKKDLQCERITPEFTMTLSTNSLGQRGPEPASIEPGGILFLGDSFTLGYGVDDGEEFPALVGEALSHELGQVLPIWNTGVGGVGNGRWIDVLQREALELQPSVIVMQMCGNDFDDNWSEAMYSLSQAGELTRTNSRKQPGIKRALQKFVECIPGLAYSRLVCSFRGGSSTDAREGVVLAGSNDESDALTWAIVERAIQECEDRNLRVVLMTAAVSEERQARAEELGVPVVNIPLKSEMPSLYYQCDGHWNERGHVLAANLLIAELLEDQVGE